MIKEKNKPLRSGRSMKHYYFASITTVLLLSVLIMGLMQSIVAVVFFRSEKREMLEKFVIKVTQNLEEGNLKLEEDIEAVNFMAEIAESNLIISDGEGLVKFNSYYSNLREGSQIPIEILNEIDEYGFYSDIGDLEKMLPASYFLYGIAIKSPDGDSKGYIMASADASGFYLYMLEIITFYLLSALVVIALSIFLAIYLTNRTIKPLDELAKAAKNFGEGDFSARVKVRGDDEIAQLSIMFNEMAGSFESSEFSHRHFMGDLSHELRTPMTSIKGFIDAILDGAIPPDKIEHYLTIVSEEVGRLSKLTQNMLDLSKIEAGDYNLNLIEFNIWETVAKVIDINEKRIDEKEINILFRGENNVANVKADTDMVYQVIYNLVDNAIKFTSQQGQICVQVLVGKSFSTISVKNTGIGISDDEIEKIFQRLYKSDKSRGINKKGSGLGLHICKVLVNHMGGFIWAESDGSSYTEFLFTLPNASKSRLQAKEKANSD